MERQLRREEEIPPLGLTKDQWLPYQGISPQDDYDEHVGPEDYKQIEDKWDIYRGGPSYDVEKLDDFPELKPWTGKEKQDWTETDTWLADQEKRYGPAGILKQNGGYGPASWDASQNGGAISVSDYIRSGGKSRRSKRKKRSKRK